MGGVTLGAACPALPASGTDVDDAGTGTVDMPVDPDTGMLWKTLYGKSERVMRLSFLFKPGSFNVQLAFLTKKYGAPTYSIATKMQNGYGATWVKHSAAWNLKNGDSIIAYDVDRADVVNVVFQWKNKVTVPAAKSPY